MANGTLLQGGMNSQKRVYGTCNAPAPSGSNNLQVDSPEERFCHQVLPYRPDFKMLPSHTPPYAILVSGTYQISSGPMVTATWAAPNSVIFQGLNRNLAAGATATK